MHEAVVNGSAVLSALSALVAIVAFLVEATQMRRARRGALRPLIGWTIAVVGVAAAVSAGWALQADRLSLGGRGFILTLAVIGGFLLTALGAAFAVLSPSVDLADVRELVSAVERKIRQSEQGDRFDPRYYVELGVRRTGHKMSRRLSRSILPSGTTTFLCGKPGSGKSVALRRLVADQCRRSMRSRRPRDLTTYVEVRLLKTPAPINVGTIRNHLAAAADADDTSAQAKFVRYINEQGSRYRWLFAFDISDELSPDEASRYIQAVDEFMQSRQQDRAIVAIRNRPLATEDVLTVGTLSPLHLQTLLQRYGVTGTTHSDLLNRLLLDTELMDLREDVALMSRLAAYWANSPYRGESRYEIVERFIASQFNRDNSIGNEPLVAHAEAQSIAYRLLVDPWLVCTPAETAALVISNLGRHEGRRFRFRSTLVQAHMAASHMRGDELPEDLSDFLDRGDWRTVLEAVLRAGHGQVPDNLVSRLGQLARSHAPRDGQLDEHSMRLVPGEFRWPLQQLHAMTVLRNGLSREQLQSLAPDVRPALDNTLRLAIFAGAESARRNGVRLLPLATVDVQRIAIESLLEPRSSRTIKRLVVAQLGMCGDILDRCASPVRLKLIFSIAAAGLLTPMIDALEYTRGSSVTARRLAAHLAKLTQYAALGLAAFLIAKQANAASLNVTSIVVALLPIVYLITKLRHFRHPDFDEPRAYVEAALFWAVFVIGGVVALTSLIDTVVDLIYADGAAILDVGQAWLATWPFAIFLLLSCDQSQLTSWWLPQRSALRVVLRDILTPHHRSRIRGSLAYLLSWRRAAAAVAVALIAIATAIDLPIDDATEATTDGWSWVGVMVAGIAVLSKSHDRQINNWRDLKRLERGDIDADKLLVMMDSAFRRGRRTVPRFLAAIAATEPGYLRPALPLLSDLERLLAFLSKTLPDGSKEEIKDAMWVLAPTFEFPRFRSWAMAFDKDHHGFLIGLAGARRERSLLSRAIQNAQHTSVFQI